MAGVLVAEVVDFGLAGVVVCVVAAGVCARALPSSSVPAANSMFVEFLSMQYCPIASRMRQIQEFAATDFIYMAVICQ